jgi:putative ABC transport system permease protein
MKYLPLVFAGLWRKPARTIFTFLSIVVAFILFGILAGLDSGFDHILAVSRLDRLFVDPRFGGRIPMSYVDQVAGVPGVTVVAPRLGLPGFYKDPKNRMGVIMSDSRFFAARPELTATKDEMAALDKNRTGALVTIFLAKQYGWKVGDKVPFISNVATSDGGQTWTFDILGIIDDTDAPGEVGFFIGNYEYLNQRQAKDKDLSDRFLVRIKDPNQATEISRTIDRLFANSSQPTRTESEKTQNQSGLASLGSVSFLTHAVIGAVLFMLLFLTGNTMMQSVRERTSEFGVLKTLGFSDGGVLALVISEAVILCGLAGLAGLTLVHTAGAYYASLLPDIAGVLLMTWASFFEGLGLALLTALAASVFPALRAGRLNVVDALAGR